MQNINEWLLKWLNGFAEYEIMGPLVFLFADLPIFFLPIFLLGMWIFYTYKQKNIDKKQDLLFIFYATILGIIISLIIQQFVAIDRPEAYLETTGKLLLSHVPDASFPSDHATVSVAFLSALFLAYYKRVGLCFLPFVIIMNLCRVIAGVHWPFDIVAGTIVGIFSAIVMFKYISKIKLVKTFNMWIIKLMWYLKL